MQFRNYYLIRSELLSVTAYLLMLVLYFVISFIPDNRLWGLNWWGYFPIWVPMVLLGTGLCFPIILYSLFHVYDKTKDDDKADNVKVYYYFSSAIIIIVALSFYFFRVKTHFLGDGYGLLTMLGTNMAAYHQVREFGESLIHLTVFDLINIPNEYGALLSYRIISIIAGILFISTLVVAAWKLYSKLITQILFVFTGVSGGYLLLFFGYIENYSLLLYCVSLFTLCGLLITKEKLNRLFIIPIYCLAVFFHIIGVILFPAVIYLLLQNTKPGARISSQKPITWILVIIVLGVAASLVFNYFYTNYYFFRFSFVPIFENRFTVEGYTLFSLNHILDFINLIVLLTPGILIFLVWVIFSKTFSLLKSRENLFLMILSLSTLGAAFIFDPKLGMPRDWDLFAFAGLPLVVLTFNMIIITNVERTSKIFTLMLIILLNFACLIPRVASQMMPDISIAHFYNYIELDKTKNRGVSGFLHSYYVSIGDKEKASGLKSHWRTKYPEIEMLERAKELKSELRFTEAINLYSRILVIDPVHFDVYNNMAECYMQTKEYNKAGELFDIARGMSPYNPGVWNNIGWVNFYQNKYEIAENAWLKSIEYDSTNVHPFVGLMSLYYSTNNRQKYIEMLTITVKRDDAPGQVHLVYGDLLVQQGRIDEAIKEYDKAIAKGVDPLQVEKLKQRALKMQ